MKIDWRGNSGYLFPDPGKVKSAVCGVCNSKMKAKRNVLGPTSWAGSMAGINRRHDSFFCPNYGELWHEEIYRLKLQVYVAEMNHSLDFKRIRRLALKEIRKILGRQVPRSLKTLYKK